MTTAVQLIAWATSKVGIVIPTPGVSFAVLDSCSLFTSAGYEENGVGVSSEISPAWQAGWFENAGRYDTAPDVGAQIFIDLTGQGRQVFHTGFVTKVYPDGSTDTIENNAGAHDGHPNGVFPNHRGPVGDGFTLAFGHPPYTAESAAPPHAASLGEPPITALAVHISDGSNLPVSRIVIHATCPPNVPYPNASAAGTARGTAGYFQQTSSGGSAHYIEDVAGEEHCVPEDEIAWHAPPNERSIGIEICGQDFYTRDQWLSPQVWPAVRRAAARARDVADRQGVPLVRLTVADLRSGRDGICGHADVSDAFKQTDHTDPGPNFPWDHFMAEVLNAVPAPVPPPPPVVTDFPEDHMKRIDVHVQGNGPHGPVGLDDQGHGSTLVDVPAGHVITAFPNTAGYVEVPQFVGAQNDGGKDRVFWKGPPNMAPFDAHVWVAD